MVPPAPAAGPPPGAPPIAPPPPEGEHRAGVEVQGAEEDGHLRIWIDAVLGWGKGTAVEQGQASSATPIAPFSTGLVKVRTRSFLVGFAVNVAEGFSVGVRMPFTHGTIYPEGTDSRGTFALGNLEIEPEYETEIADELKLVLALGIATPTGQGVETPENVSELNPANVQQTDYDRLLLNHVAAASRGFEENALFEPHRLSFVPKVGIAWMNQGFQVEPYVKLENLISTISGAEHSYLGEFVAGTRLAYRVVDELDVGARVWTSIGISGDTDKVGVVEPEVRGHFGSIHPFVGVVVPFAGEALTDPRFTGLRLGVLGSF